ncbi:hypothetical protein [Butyrivibrio sp. TB]|uniref:hypothetical protein n=1 Tax=Butyrivibrio sp. TB TaxID=1520809 RepID=UPI0008BF4592|nr:hypothetical protein [Butyrivibrio sp. TB]SEQ18859.1 hypothetical protein SAMN02910382_02280 [Butyrivibrio sp. TB]
MKRNGLIFKAAAAALIVVLGAGAAISLPRIARAETVTSTSQEVEALKTASVNSAEFNAYYYYITYPDLQAAFGANADLLYVHWTTVGKAEGRKGVDPATSATTTPSASATASTGTVALGTPKYPYKDVNGIRYIWKGGDPNKRSLASADYVFDIAAMTAIENDPMLATYANEVRNRNDTNSTYIKSGYALKNAQNLGISENLYIVVNGYDITYNQALPCFMFYDYYMNCPAVQRAYKPYEVGAVYAHWVANGSKSTNGLNGNREM